MDDKRIKYRIPDSKLSNEFKSNGEILYGEDLNKIVTITKGGINYNAELFESYLYGDDYRPFYHGNEVDWQTKDEYIDYGIVYWVRSTLDVLTGLPYVYVTKMEYNGTSESWVEKEIIKFIDTEHLNNVLKDYLKKSGGDMHGNLDMGSHDITNVDYLSTHRVRADKNLTKEIALLSSAGQEEANIKIDENGNIDFNGKTVVNIELPEVEAKLDVKLDGKLDKLTGGGETGLRVYAAFNGGVETSLDVDVNPSSFTLARRGGNGEVWTGDATKKHDAVPLGQLNTFLETKVDKVEGKQLSDENFTSAEKSKLAGLESSRFIGQFVSLQALNTSHPTAPIGAYAYVDEGSGKDTVKYVWDSSDSTWVLGTPSTAELTPAMVKQLYEENDDTNAYTDAEKGKVALIDSKLDKVSTESAHSRAYVINEDGTQGHIAASYTTLANTIARRSYWGNLEVGEAKTSNDAVPLGQADERYAVKSIEESKQDKLVAGDNITIDPVTNVISSSSGNENVQDKMTEWGVRFVKGQASSDGERVKRIDGLITLGEATGIVHNIGHDQINVHNSFDSIYAFRYERVIEDGNHFNKYPLVYIKQESFIEDGVEYEYYWLCATQLQGYYAPHVFRKNDGSLRDYILVGVYEAFRDANGKLRSIPNVLPTVSRSANNFLTDARLNDGLGIDSEYTITDIMEQHYLNHRWLIRLGTKNIQSKLVGFTRGRRNTTDLILEDGTSVNHVVVSNAIGAEYRIGQTIKVGDGQDGTQALVGRLITNILVDNPTSGQTSIYFDGEPVNVVSGQVIGNRAYITGATDGIVASDGYLLENNGKYPCVIEGIENPFGNVWKNIAGIKLLGDDIYVTNDLRNYNWLANVDNFVKLSYKVPQANGYAKEMGFDPKHPYAQITKAIGGSSTTYYADYFYQNYVVDAYRTVFVGGFWDFGFAAGLWLWLVGHGLGATNPYFGSRLSKRPN